MIPITWPELANIHPFAPMDQVEGYQEMFEVRSLKELSQCMHLQIHSRQLAAACNRPARDSGTWRSPHTCEAAVTTAGRGPLGLPPSAGRVRRTEERKPLSPNCCPSARVCSARFPQDLAQQLATITGFDAVSLQPNSGGRAAGRAALDALSGGRAARRRCMYMLPATCAALAI